MGFHFHSHCAWLRWCSGDRRQIHHTYESNHTRNDLLAGSKLCVNWKSAWLDVLVVTLMCFLWTCGCCVSTFTEVSAENRGSPPPAVVFHQCKHTHLRFALTLDFSVILKIIKTTEAEVKLVICQEPL